MSETLAASQIGVSIDAKSGRVRLNKAAKLTGADYAEYFVNLDRSIHAVGEILVLDGDGVRRARDPNEYILGVVSATPSVIGNASSYCWHGRYVRDDFGRLLMQQVSCVEFEYEIHGTPCQYRGPETDAPVSIPVHAKRYLEDVPIESVEYAPHSSYVSRKDRTEEYTLVSLLGRALVRVQRDLPPQSYLDAFGGLSYKPTRLMAMKMESPYDPARGYGIASCLVRNPLL